MSETTSLRSGSIARDAPDFGEIRNQPIGPKLKHATACVIMSLKYGVDTKMTLF